MVPLPLALMPSPFAAPMPSPPNCLRTQDWWWKARLGKCYYQLGMMRDAEKQFRSSLKNQVGAGARG